MEVVLFIDKNQVGDIKTVTSMVNPEVMPIESIGEGYTFNQEQIPIPQYIPGKGSILKLNITTMELYYEYFDRPLTPEEELAKVKSELESTKTALEGTQKVLDMILMGEIPLV